MTQKDDITLFLLDNPNSTTKQVQDAFTKFPKPSVRRVLSNLRKEGVNIKANKLHVNRLLKEFTDLIQETLPVEFKKVKKELLFRRKIIKVMFYCPDDPHRAGFGHKVFALTYEDNDIDRSDELIDALQLGFDEIEQGLQDAPDFPSPKRGNRTFVNMKRCTQATEFGYDDEMEFERPPFKFPDIEVGEE